MWRKTWLAVVSSFFLMLPGCGGENSTREGGGSGSTSVEVTPAAPNVYEGKTIQFQAKVMGQSDQAVTWSLQAQAIGMIDDTGLYTAPGDASGGDIVMATSRAVPSASGIAKVIVLAHQVTISPSTATLSPGGTQTFTATVDGVAGANVTWSIQELGGGSISGGTYEAPLKTGFYHIVATSVADSSLSTSATISVTTSTGRFTSTGSMQNGHSGHAATLLSDGTVLVAGGSGRVSPLCHGGIASSELYDPVAGSFATTGSMLNARVGHAAVLLPDGEVLITGGLGAPVQDCEDLGGGPSAQSSAELYDPSTHGFKFTQSMAQPRVSHTATLLGTGKVLIVGDSNDTGVGSTSELYDPESRRFTLTGSMSVARYCHTATLMPNGKVLIAGGGSPPTGTAEIYDPTTGAFMLTGSMLTARCGHTATLLQNGLVLITGGGTIVNGEASPSASAELYNPITGSFSATGSMVEVRDSHTATLLPNGTVLVAGGDSTAELFDPATGSFSPTGAMEVERSGHSATLLKNGAVLVAGGAAFPSPSRTAELYK
jgi:hypothetical protein